MMRSTAAAHLAVVLALLPAVAFANDLPKIDVLGDYAVKAGSMRYQVNETAHTLDIWEAPLVPIPGYPLPVGADARAAGSAARGVCFWGMKAGMDAKSEGKVLWEQTWTVRAFIEGQDAPAASCEIPADAR